MELIWLIPLLPGIGAAINGLVGIRSFSKRQAALVGCSTMTGALLLSVVAFVQLLGLEERYYRVVLADWIPGIPLAMADGHIGTFEVPWAFTYPTCSGATPPSRSARSIATTCPLVEGSGAVG